MINSDCGDGGVTVAFAAVRTPVGEMLVAVTEDVRAAEADRTAGWHQPPH
ncbi:MAG: hypothetical protein H0U15_00760 [Geodermatophilaceae bacterium]|nr:hypothetical protein [Geodermatophilaceae bacterium]